MDVFPDDVFSNQKLLMCAGSVQVWSWIVCSALLKIVFFNMK